MLMSCAIHCMQHNSRYEIELNYYYLIIINNNSYRALPPWSRLLTPGVFKPSCSTPFTLFLHLVSVYWPFQLYFITKLSPQYLRFQLPSYSLFLPNPPFSCIYLQHNSSLNTSSYSLRSPSDPACLPCTASRVGGGWGPGG